MPPGPRSLLNPTVYVAVPGTAGSSPFTVNVLAVVTDRTVGAAAAAVPANITTGNIPATRVIADNAAIRPSDLVLMVSFPDGLAWWPPADGVQTASVSCEYPTPSG